MPSARTLTHTTHQCSQWIAAAAIAGAVTIAGCGSSNKPQTTTGSSAAQGIKFAQCMRSHGVTNFPDPGNGVQLPQGSSPAVTTAMQDCENLMPAAEAGSQATAQEKASMLRVSQCMRKHGVSGFPDPIASVPRNPRFSSVSGTPGALIGIPITINTRSPAFKQASRACRLP